MDNEADQMRSDMIKQGLERTPHRALIKGTGVPESELSKPFIGVATSFTDLIPGHVGMRDLERFIEKGVHTGGGYSFFFGIPGVCDGIAMGHKGMHYSLPTRELIADMVESVAEAHRLDGLVLLTNCDKITPGMLMAAARLDIPCIVVTAGPMMSGRGEAGRKYSFVTDTFEAMARYKAGVIDDKELKETLAAAKPYREWIERIRIRLDDTVLFDSAARIDVSAHRRRIGYVFQEGRLFPHLSVAANLDKSSVTFVGKQMNVPTDGKFGKFALQTRGGGCLGAEHFLETAAQFGERVVTDGACETHDGGFTHTQVIR